VGSGGEGMAVSLGRGAARRACPPGPQRPFARLATGYLALGLSGAIGPGSVAELAAALDEIEGVLGVAAGDVNEIFD
jgi:hypothetical protein